MSKPVVYVTPARSSAARFPQGATLRTARKKLFVRGHLALAPVAPDLPGGGSQHSPARQEFQRISAARPTRRGYGSLAA